MLNGIDVARYQGSVNWDKVKASGVQFAILRAVSTNHTGIYIDPTFERNYAECKRVGMPCGVYYYTYATSTATADKELAMLKKAIDGKQFEYPIYVDVEENRLKPLSKDALTDLVVYACEKIESWKCYAGVYTYTNYKNTELNMGRLAPYTLWIADYRGKVPSGSYDIWQYSSKGSVNGINGNVDMNYCYKNDFPQTIKKLGLNGYGETEPFFPPKGYFCMGDKHKNIGKIAEFMYAKFPAYTDKKALGDYYGSYIKASIKEFQHRTKLTEDGCVGKITLAMLKDYGFKEN